jgi:hypothetical protein
MWTGRDIVRTKGRRAKDTMGTLVVTKEGEILGIGRAFNSGLYGPQRLGYRTVNSLGSGAPNLALNVKDPTFLTRETWILVLTGVVLQLAAFAIAWMTTYRWQFSEVSPDGRSYGYPLFVAGTVLQSAGLLGCAYAIQAATTEYYSKYQANQPAGETNNAVVQRGGDLDVAVVRLQQACTVGDQEFHSFAIFNAFDNPNILFSRRAENHRRHGYVQIIFALHDGVGTPDLTWFSLTTGLPPACLSQCPASQLSSALAFSGLVFGHCIGKPGSSSLA